MSEDDILKLMSQLPSWGEFARQLNGVEWSRPTQNWKSFCNMSPSEEKSAAAQSELDDVTTCCICDETYTDPVILPCVHTFCLTCLQHIGTYTNKNPGDPMPCPLCRQEFTIPKDGFAALKKNFFMVRLIDITATLRRDSSVCDNCDMHKHENLCLYCSDCNEVLCMLCLREWHQDHRMSDLNSAADILRSQINSYVNTAKLCMSGALKKKERLRDNRFAVVKKIQPFEAEVNRVRRNLKALIDRHADSLLQNHESLKKEQLDDIEIEDKELDKHLDSLKNFEVSCAELASNDRHGSLFCKMASELKKQIVELKRLNESIVERQLRSLEIDFTKTVPTAFEIYETKNIIGVVKAKIDYIGKPELVTIIGANNTAVNEGDGISGMAVSYNDVFLTYENNPVVSIYDAHTHKCTTQMTLEGFVREVDLRDCVSVAGNVYIVNGITREILRIDQNRDFMKWSTGSYLGRLSVSAESTIVATCYETSALREYSLQGIVIQEIKLCSSIVHPQHAIKLSNGYFVVSHGIHSDLINRVCMVNDVGGITKSFGDRWSGYSSVLSIPTCLAVDENGNILVLDRNNSRVLLLSPELEFKREILTEADVLPIPVAMHLDEKTSRLYIANYNWETFQRCNNRVLVFNIK